MRGSITLNLKNAAPDWAGNGYVVSGQKIWISTAQGRHQGAAASPATTPA